jgi:hypothetical protein
MSTFVPPLTKKCAKCKDVKNYNDDFTSNKSCKDYKDAYCRKCKSEFHAKRREKYGVKRSAAEKKNMVNYTRTMREQRLFGEKKPISEAEIDEMYVWLKNPEAWEGISAYRTRVIKETLRRCFHQIKYHSQYIAPKTK